ncbi:MAG TPA: hypothetical protein PKM45_03745, partial [Giesbergeria sp.]|nr:hypothetical protein [Ottowia sp.]HNQ09514.1 hypothetical protein [Giesbergeria sp.]
PVLALRTVTYCTENEETPWQATQDDGQPLLVGLHAANALPMADQLRLALADLWQVTLPLRLARMAGSASGKRIQLSSFSIDPGDMP